MSLKTPKPETKTAWLVSAGLPTPGWTIHHYVETRATPDASWEHVFACSKTGVQRIWGVENRTAYLEYGAN